MTTLPASRLRRYKNEAYKNREGERAATPAAFLFLEFLTGQAHFGAALDKPHTWYLRNQDWVRTVSDCQKPLHRVAN